MLCTILQYFIKIYDSLAHREDRDSVPVEQLKKISIEEIRKNDITILQLAPIPRLRLGRAATLVLFDRIAWVKLLLTWKGTHAQRIAGSPTNEAGRTGVANVLVVQKHTQQRIH